MATQRWEVKGGKRQQPGTVVLVILSLLLLPPGLRGQVQARLSTWCSGSACFRVDCAEGEEKVDDAAVTAALVPGAGRCAVDARGIYLSIEEGGRMEGRKGCWVLLARWESWERGTRKGHSFPGQMREGGNWSFYLSVYVRKDFITSSS